MTLFLAMGSSLLVLYVLYFWKIEIPNGELYRDAPVTSGYLDIAVKTIVGVLSMGTIWLSYLALSLMT